MAADEQIPAGPLTKEERQHIRRIIQSDEHVRWLWSSVRLFAGWLAAVAAGVAATKYFLLDLLQGKH